MIAKDISQLEQLYGKFRGEKTQLSYRKLVGV